MSMVEKSLPGSEKTWIGDKISLLLNFGTLLPSSAL